MQTLVLHNLSVILIVLCIISTYSAILFQMMPWKQLFMHSSSFSHILLLLLGVPRNSQAKWDV